MASKKFNREQMQHCVGVLDELAKSGLSKWTVVSRSAYVSLQQGLLCKRD